MSIAKARHSDRLCKGIKSTVMHYMEQSFTQYSIALLGICVFIVECDDFDAIGFEVGNRIRVNIECIDWLQAIVAKKQRVTSVVRDPFADRLLIYLSCCEVWTSALLSCQFLHYAALIWWEKTSKRPDSISIVESIFQSHW